MSTLTVNDLRFELRRSDRRRTLEITVDRGGGLILAAPTNASESLLQDFARRKRAWIYRQLARKSLLGTQPLVRLFVDGEGFPYLGRHYRLRLAPDGKDPVRLIAGRLVMPAECLHDGRAHLIHWYCEQGKRWLKSKTADFANRMEAQPSGIRVRDLGYRWGSCSEDATVNFHWKTMMMPPRIVEYIVVHELTHLHEPHHTQEFWRRVERAMPDFMARREWLLANGRNFDVL